MKATWVSQDYQTSDGWEARFQPCKHEGFKFEAIICWEGSRIGAYCTVLQPSISLATELIDKQRGNRASRLIELQRERVAWAEAAVKAVHKARTEWEAANDNTASVQ